MHHVPVAFQCIYGCGYEREENRNEEEGVIFQGEGREWRLSGLSYADDLVLCGESEEDLRAMV